jgi:hypothetical protein
MSNVRPLGRELQDQVLAAAREGQKRVNRTVRIVTATAQQIRPQLPSLPEVHINVVKLPSPAQLREKAPEFIAKLPSGGQLREKAPELLAKLPNASQLRERAPELIAKLPNASQLRERAPELISRLPSADQLRTMAAARVSRLPSTTQIKVGAEEMVVQFRSVQRQVVSQVRDAAAPLAKQAGAVFAQVSVPAAKISQGRANGRAASSAAAEPEPASRSVPVILADKAEPATQADNAKDTQLAKPKAPRTTKASQAAKATRTTKASGTAKAAGAARATATTKAAGHQAASTASKKAPSSARKPKTS